MGRGIAVVGNLPGQGTFQVVTIPKVAAEASYEYIRYCRSSRYLP
jgi:hypothetical protein